MVYGTRWGIHYLLGLDEEDLLRKILRLLLFQRSRGGVIMDNLDTR